MIAIFLDEVRKHAVKMIDEKYRMGDNTIDEQAYECLLKLADEVEYLQAALHECENASTQSAT